MARLEGKVAIVTGAAQGLGKAFAGALAREGAKVTLADIDDCEPAAAEIASTYQGAESLALKTDVTSEASCKDMVAETIAKFGKLDILVSNAAISGKIRRAGFEDITVEEWDQVMAVNVRGPFLCAKAAVPEMRKQKYGKIVHMASGTAFRGAPRFLHYVSSKGAVLALTRSLSREVGGDNICVNTIAPGLTMSESIAAKGDEPEWQDNFTMSIASRAIKRDEVPEDLVGTMLYLVSPDSDFVTGQCIVVDGGGINN
jgi:NAD(P)-dependent dehydrogenase (short-subunit alcohol dehydrogenase family)